MTTFGTAGAAAPPVQTYATHRRRFPLFHHVALPILLANVAVAVGHAIRRPSMWNAWLVVVSLGLVAGLVASRASTLYVQNRVIALEMRLRLAATLPPELRARIPELRLRQLIALRFAGDGELAGLVERCLRGELATADAIKREIREWRPDFARA
ncbi:MAG: hypothetical protein HOQ17_08750 [Gemmatimonadaceae bacterium]|nr:hypothetical protein [Gemmatimonadaceae bacterium]NUO94723.1 hypothetical protein [Gemmatimonadaceae bacterium]NUP54396.1 hypothetical protein [Gemmatimonadaceae bacterium]NUP69789.1 hypothetical protein [Gemmatimonadaceae bacterium]NUR35589.1 hypothetical protein [Gemmatimonadaceae bacterium]